MIFVADNYRPARVLPSPPEMVAVCRRRGIALAALVGGKLRVDAPAGSTDPGLLDDLRALKPDLMAYLLLTGPTDSPKPDSQPESAFVHSLDRPPLKPIPAILADRTIGVVQPDPPRDLADLAGKPLDHWRYLTGDWGDIFLLAWRNAVERNRGQFPEPIPDDLDLIERRAFDEVVCMPHTPDPRAPREAVA